MAKDNNVRVVQHEGKWEVIENGTDRILKVLPTEKEAIEYSKSAAHRTESKIHVNEHNSL